MMEPDDACITVYIYVYICGIVDIVCVCVSVCPLLGTSQEVTLDSFHWIHDCVSCCSRSAPYQGHVDKKPTSVLQTSCFTLYSKGMGCDIEATLAWLTEARRSSRPQRICKTACRAPDCPTALMYGNQRLDRTLRRADT